MFSLPGTADQRRKALRNRQNSVKSSSGKTGHATEVFLTGIALLGARLFAQLPGTPVLPSRRRAYNRAEAQEAVSLRRLQGF